MGFPAGIRTNLNEARLSQITRSAKEIYEWSVARGHPEKYGAVVDQTQVRNLLYALDLMDTVLTRFGVCSQLCFVALKEMDRPTEEESLFWNFWQIDVEEFFSAGLLELSYQLSKAWETLDRFGRKEPNLRVLRVPFERPGKVLLARHKFTHFQADLFEELPLAEEYSILRRPYTLLDGKLEKELAKETMPRVASLIGASVDAGQAYLEAFHSATVG